MSKILDIKPYNKFWMNCVFNNIFSLLSKEEQSYLDLPFMNIYDYCFYDVEENCSGIDINRIRMQHILEKIVFVEYIDERKNYLKVIKANIDNERPIGALVDLYYWLPNTIIYQKKHWFHYTLIIGYDDKGYLYVLDEDNDGYRLQKLSEKKLVKAFLNERDEIPLAYYVFKENVPQYKIEFKEIKKNAEIILKQLFEIIHKEKIWGIDGREEEQAIKMMIASASRLYNTQIGNRYLVNYINKQKCFSSSKLNLLISYCNDTETKWRNIHNMFYKHDLKRTIPDFDLADCISKECVSKEILFWRELLNLI